MRVVVIAIVHLALVAVAAGDPRARAEKYYTAGENAYRLGNFAGAAQSFELAYDAMPEPELAFSAAQAHRLQYQLDGDPERIRRAIDLYEKYVTAVKTGGRVADAATHLDSLRRVWRDLATAGKVSDESIAVERTQITVWADAAGATITVDGKPVRAYDYVDVAPGEHVVAVEARGYKPFTRKISVANNAKASVQADLVPLPARVRFATEAGARLAVDGRPVAMRDGEAELPAGKHHVAITRRGRRPFSRDLDVPPGASIDVDAALAPTGQRRASRRVWLVAGILGAGAAVTGTFALITDFQAADLRDQPTLTVEQADRYETLRGRRDDLRLATYVIAGTAVAAAATALALHLFDHPAAEAPPRSREPDGEAIRFTPVAVSGGVGIVVHATY